MNPERATRKPTRPTPKFKKSTRQPKPRPHRPLPDIKTEFPTPSVMDPWTCPCGPCTRWRRAMRNPGIRAETGHTLDTVTATTELLQDAINALHDGVHDPMCQPPSPTPGDGRRRQSLLNLCKLVQQEFDVLFDFEKRLAAEEAER